jgi:hypothetical protein
VEERDTEGARENESQCYWAGEGTDRYCCLAEATKAVPKSEAAATPMVSSSSRKSVADVMEGEERLGSLEEGLQVVVQFLQPP